MPESLLILGTGSFAEQLAEVVEEMPEFELAGFVENQNLEVCKSGFAGKPVYWVGEISTLVETHVGVCALGSTLRQGFISQAEQASLKFATLRHRSTMIGRGTKIGEGCILLAGANIAPLSSIGKNTIVNRSVLIGHHTKIGECVTLSPGVNIAGKCIVGNGSYIGMGAIVLDGIRIGRGCVVGAGAVVTKDVPDGTQVVGVPARIVKTAINGY